MASSSRVGLLLANHTFAQTLMEAARTWSTKLQARKESDLTNRRKEDKLGASRIHAWSAASQAIINHTNTWTNHRCQSSRSGRRRAVFCEVREKLGWRTVTKKFKHFRIQGFYDKTKKRLEIYLAPQSDAHDLFFGKRQVLAYIETGLQAYIQELPCIAPPGDLEHQLQANLDGSQTSAAS